VIPELVDAGPGHAPRTRWGQQFDASITDVFKVQAQIASDVAQALNVALRPSASQPLAARPTTSPEAHDLYLRANQYYSYEDRASVAIALQLYQQAVTLDSNFALAWAKLSEAHAYTYWQRYDPSRQQLALAQHAAERAAALEPYLPEAHLAMGFYHYWGHRDYDRALKEFAFTERMQPNNADVVEAIGLVQRRQGR